MKYKVGDRVRIVSNYSGHGFNIGTEVCIRSVDKNDDYYAADDNGETWFINHQECEAIIPHTEYRALYEQEKAIIEQIKAAFSRYVKTEGCSCCQDTIGHKEAEKRLAELLNPEPYEDGSGWKWY